MRVNYYNLFLLFVFLGISTQAFFMKSPVSIEKVKYVCWVRPYTSRDNRNAVFSKISDFYKEKVQQRVDFFILLLER